MAHERSKWRPGIGSCIGWRSMLSQTHMATKSLLPRPWEDFRDLISSIQTGDVGYWHLADIRLTPLHVR